MIHLKPAAKIRFTVNRLAMILFKTANSRIIKDCLSQFKIKLPNVLIIERTRKFMTKYEISDNQCCSPRDQSLGLEAPRGHKVKSWSWSRVYGSWSCVKSLGLGLGLVTKVSIIFKTF